MESLLAKPHLLANLERPLPMPPEELAQFRQHLFDAQEQHKTKLREIATLARRGTRRIVMALE
jgi:hypothetical protein